MTLDNLPAYLQVAAYDHRVKRAQAASQDADPIAWIEREFWIPETGGAIVLADYQRRVIREALRKDANGLYVYSLVLYSDIKKSAKSTISAAVALYLAWHTAWESVRIVGNDLKQADSRTFFYIKRAVELNPRLRAVCEVKNYQITLPNKTTIQAIPVDPKGEAGGGDLITCFTELWAYKNAAAQQMWSETTLSPLKYGKSLRWCESYAGFEGESPVLENLYDQGVKHGQRVDDDLELYVNPQARMLTLWNTRPRLSWQSSQYYSAEAAVLTPSEFARMHRNQWQSASHAFVPAAWWQACASDSLPAMTRYTPWVIGIDAAVSSDCFALVGVTRHDGVIVVRYAEVWTPPAGGHIDFEQPRAVLASLARQHNIECVTFDPYQLEYFAAQLRAEGKLWMRPFGQQAPRLEADRGLYDMIRERRLQHANVSVLTEHIANADAKIEERKMRLVKRAQAMKIDAAVALSMAAHVAQELAL